MMEHVARYINFKEEDLEAEDIPMWEGDVDSLSTESFIVWLPLPILWRWEREHREIFIELDLINFNVYFVGYLDEGVTYMLPVFKSIEIYEYHKEHLMNYTRWELIRYIKAVCVFLTEEDVTGCIWDDEDAEKYCLPTVEEMYRDMPPAETGKVLVTLLKEYRKGWPLKEVK